MTLFEVDTDGVMRLPALVRGRLVSPDERGVTITQPVLDRTTLEPTGEQRVLLLPRPDPVDLLEPDAGAAIAELARLPFADVLAYLRALGAELAPDRPAVRGALAAAGSISHVDARATRVFAAQLATMFDPEGIAAAVDRDLGTGDHPGRVYLDGWVEVPGRSHQGATARMAGLAPPATRPRRRAIPTRQLHITSGNSPLVPLVSLLWALATKGAAVLKTPVDAVLGTSAVAAAMAAAEPDHPLTRHTSIVYWPGGDAGVEDALLADGSFDRWVVWGSSETVAAVVPRARGANTIVMGPRVGVSLIGAEALTDVPATARRAASDALIADQAACSASLVHFVEGSEADALAYCEELQTALADWDRSLPHVLPRRTLGRIRALRRGQLVHATWFQNGRWPYLTSAVVYAPAGFDLAQHPGGRCVVVRRVDQLRDAVRALHAGIAAVGVAPESARVELAVEIAARGVDRVMALGDVEHAYAGMSQDGMRVLSQLVRWVDG